jgi:hypothetical protein
MPPGPAQIEQKDPATYGDWSLSVHQDGWYELTLDFEFKPGPASLAASPVFADNAAWITATIDWDNAGVVPIVWDEADHTQVEFHSGIYVAAFLIDLTTSGSLNVQGTNSNQRAHVHTMIECNAGTFLRARFNLSQNFSSPTDDWDAQVVKAFFRIRYAGKNNQDFGA